VVIDDSLSRGYRQGGKSALDLAKEASAEIIHGTGSQDSLTVLTTAPGADPLVRESSLDDAGKAISRIDALTPTDAACDWGATFKSVDDLLSTAAFPQKQVILITDLRKPGWSAGVSDTASRWAANGVGVRIIDVGSRQTSDVSLERFVQEDPIVLPGAPVKLTASIRNGTSSVITGAQAVLSIDGNVRPVVLPELSPGTGTEVPMSITIESAGEHTVKFALPDDELAGDNARYLSVNVRPRLTLNLIDGREGAGPFESAGDFVQLALSVGADAWQARHLADTDPQALHPGRADLTVITDAANLSATMVGEYEKLVRQGMGLFIFCGEQVDPDFYNQRLYREGQGLLPARLDRISDNGARGLVIESLTDSPLGQLGRLAPAALSKIQTRRLMQVELPAAGAGVGAQADAIRVLARWNDPEGHPAIIEKRFGRGRVLLWTTSADREWTDWPIDPTYVLAVRSAAAGAAWPDSGEDNLVAGHPLEYPSPQETVRDARLVAPDDPTPQPVFAEGNVFKYAHTERAGVYALRWIDSSGKEQIHQLAASFDAKAADLTPISEADLFHLLGPLEVTVIPYHAGILAAAPPGREIWRTLAATLLGLLVVETVFASWVGRER
jgi:hypothetical protein